MHNPRRTGFTLLELLLALATMAIVVGVIYGAFAVGTNSAQRGQVQIDTQQELITVLTLMARQLRNACPAPDSLAETQVLLAQNAEPEPQELWFNSFRAKAESSGPHIEFITTAGLLPQEQAQPRGVIYHYDKKNRALLYSECSAEDTSFGTGFEPERALIEDLGDMTLEFYDGQRWTDSWQATQQGGLPHAIKLTLARAEDRFTKAISLHRATRVLRPDQTTSASTELIGGQP